MLDIVEGCSIWSGDRRDADGYPIGGLVTAVSMSVDEETGSVTRRYKTLCHVGANRPPRERWLDESEVMSVEQPYSPDTTKMLRRLCKEVGEKSGKTGSASLTPKDHVHLTDIVRLYTARPGGK